MGKKKRKKSPYYKKFSAREDFWTGVSARIVFAVITFMGTVVAEVLVYGRYFLLSVPIDQDQSFLSALITWQYFVIPTIMAIIVLIAPNALNHWFHGKKESNLEEVKEMSKRRGGGGVVTTPCDGDGR